MNVHTFRRLHVEWAASSLEQKIEIVKTNATEVFRSLLYIVTNFFSQFKQFYLETWNQMVHLVSSSLLVRTFSLRKLKEAFEDGCDISELLQLLVSNQALALDLGDGIPIVYSSSSGSGMLSIRNMTEADHYHIVAYIDAIVTTKVSPKIVYNKLISPTFPSLGSEVNRTLKFTEAITDWNQTFPMANITFVGNVNSGKSSLSGHILANLGIVDSNIVERLGQQAKCLGHSSD